jgi:hypothetical protein
MQKSHQCRRLPTTTAVQQEDHQTVRGRSQLLTAAVDADLLYGMKRIARYLGLTNRQVEHMISKCEIPTFKLGVIVCTTRSGLDQHFERLLEQNAGVRGRTGDGVRD